MFPENALIERPLVAVTGQSMRPCRTETRVMLRGQRVDLMTQRICNPNSFSPARKGTSQSPQLNLGVGGQAVMMREATSPSIKVTLYLQRIQSVTESMEVLIFTKIAKCSFRDTYQVIVR